MKNEDSTEGKLNAMRRTTVNKCSDVWPNNIFSLFLSSPVKKSDAHFSPPGELEKIL